MPLFKICSDVKKFHPINIDRFVVKLSAMKLAKASVLILVCLAAAEFLIRGPLRANGDSTDFFLVYLTVKALVLGLNPYSQVDMAAALKAMGSTKITLEPFGAFRPGLYPPSTYLVFAPLGYLDWDLAKNIYLVLSLLAFVLQTAVLLMLPGAERSPLKKSLIIATSLACAPIHTGISKGQISILANCLLITGWFGSQRGWKILPPILFGFCGAIKPHLAIPFLAFLFVKRRWSVLVWSCLIPVALLLVSCGVLSYSTSGLNWISELRANFADASGAAGAASSSPENPIWYHLINMQVVLFKFTTSTSTVVALTIIFCTAMLFWLSSLLKQLESQDDLLLVSLLAVGGLLICYHRFYDGGVLLLPVAWAIASDWSKRKWDKIVVLGLCSPFLFPGAAILKILSADGTIPSFIVSSWAWDNLILAHQPWSLIFLFIGLMVSIRIQIRDRRASVDS